MVQHIKMMIMMMLMMMMMGMGIDFSNLQHRSSHPLSINGSVCVCVCVWGPNRCFPVLHFPLCIYVYNLPKKNIIITSGKWILPRTIYIHSSVCASVYIIYIGATEAAPSSYTKLSPGVNRHAGKVYLHLYTAPKLVNHNIFGLKVHTRTRTQSNTRAKKKNTLLLPQDNPGSGINK